MNNDELLKKMRQLRDSIETKDNKNEKTTTLDIIYLGEIQWNDKVNNSERYESLYIVKKQIKEINKEGKEEVRLVNNYYLGDKCIGAYLKEEPYFTSTLEEDKLQAVKSLLDKNEKEQVQGISLVALEEEQLDIITEEMSKKYGIKLKKEDIKAMAEVELEEKLEKQENGKKELNKEETNKIISDKQQIKADTKIDDKKTIGQALDLNTTEYSKVAIVYSDKLNEIADNPNDAKNSTRYSFVAIRKDGTAQIINDKLEIDASSGNNSNKEAIKVDANKTARKDNKTLSRYKIAGKDEYLSVENGQYGEVKAYYGKGKTKDGNMNVETQLETTNVRPTSRQLRELQADKKGIYKTENMAKEANEHFDNHNEESIGINAVDGDENTVDKQDVDEIQDGYIQNIVNELMQVEEIDEVFTRREIEERTVKFFEKQNNITNMKELKEQLKNDIQFDAEHMHTRGEKQ